MFKNDVHKKIFATVFKDFYYGLKTFHFNFSIAIIGLIKFIKINSEKNTKLFYWPTCLRKLHYFIILGRYFTSYSICSK